MQQNEYKDRQLLLMEPGLEPVRNVSVVQPLCECSHAALRSELLPIILHCGGGCTGLVVLAQGGWSYFIAQMCLLYSQKMNSWRKESGGALFQELSLLAVAGKKISRMQKCGKTLLAQNTGETTYKIILFSTLDYY